MVGHSKSGDFFGLSWHCMEFQQLKSYRAAMALKSIAAKTGQEFVKWVTFTTSKTRS